METNEMTPEKSLKIISEAIAIVFAFAGNYDSSLFLAAASVLNLIVPGMAMNRKADQVKCCK